MQQGTGVTPGARARLKGVLVLIVLLAPLRWEPLHAEASPLNDTVTPLRNGDGFRLQPLIRPFLSYTPSFVASSLTGVDALRTLPPLPFGLLASNSPASGFVSDIGQGALMDSVEGGGSLLRKPLLLRNSGQPGRALPYARLDLAPLEGRGLLPHANLYPGGFLSTAGLVQFKTDLAHMDVDSGRAEHDFLSSTLRLTQSWDVGGIISPFPMRVGASPQTTIVSTRSMRNVVHKFGSRPDSLSSMAGREALHSGNIVFQTQYNFPLKEPGWPEFEMLGQIQLPTRDKNPFLETGETSFLALLIASQNFGWLTASTNLGVEWMPEISEQSNVSYGAGLNAQVHPTLTLALDLFGRWQPRGAGIVAHTVDLTLGARWNPFGSLFFEANLQRSIIKSPSAGSGITWTIRVDYVF